MNKIIQSILFFLTTEQCYKEYLFKHNYYDGECFKSSLSKILGYLLFSLALIVKIPQIQKIYKNKSGEGLSIYGLFLELAAMTSMMSYSCANGFPFTAWGDIFIVAIQTAFIPALILHFSRKTKLANAFVLVYFSICYITMSGITPLWVLWYLQSATGPVLIISGKSLQIYKNYMNGHTGQLSAATIFIMFSGAVARVFTSIQETGDLLMIFTFLISTFTNGLLAFQMLYYWNVAPKKTKTK